MRALFPPAADRCWCTRSGRLASSAQPRQRTAARWSGRCAPGRVPDAAAASAAPATRSQCHHGLDLAEFSRRPGHAAVRLGRTAAAHPIWGGRTDQPGRAPGSGGTTAPPCSRNSPPCGRQPPVSSRSAPRVPMLPGRDRVVRSHERPLVASAPAVRLHLLRASDTSVNEPHAPLGAVWLIPHSLVPEPTSAPTRGLLAAHGPGCGCGG
jgi:hypothetical protein